MHLSHANSQLYYVFDSGAQRVMGKLAMYQEVDLDVTHGDLFVRRHLLLLDYAPRAPTCPAVVCFVAAPTAHYSVIGVLPRATVGGKYGLDVWG